jgi:predicted TIM-barrel fold metal-dependent hydrolase
MYSQAQLMPWARAVLARVPDAALFDAHVHIGINDTAGLLATEEEALSALAEVGSRALVFALKEPTGYRGANERMIELASEQEGFAALARLDPADGALEEAQRCVAAGAVGLKLHPRGEGFEIADPALDDVFAFAGEKRLPIMIHAGVGDPSIGAETLMRARAHPDARLILAHAAVGAFDHVMPYVDELPNLFFDTSWWNPADLWALFQLVPPSRILYASDIPFASPAEAILLTGRVAIEAGLSDEQLRSVLGGQMARLVAHEEPLDVGFVEAEPDPLAPELERLYVTLCTAVEPMLRGADAGQGLELAKAAAAAPVGDHAEVIASIGELLELAEEREDPDPLRASRTPGFDLVLAAAVLARTPRAGVPSGVQLDAA